MKKLLLIDIKRLLQNRASVAFTLLVPVVLVVLVSLLLAPYFFDSTIVNEYFVAIYNEDGHPLTNELLNTILKNKEFDKLVDAVFVYSDKEGFEQIENGAAAYIHLPAGMQETISEDKPVIIEYAGNPELPLEDAILSGAMEAASDLVNFTQNASIVLFQNIEPVNEGAADKLYSDIARKYFYEVMNRKAIYTRQNDDISPFGAMLPLEYYASALLVLFAALGGLPIAKLVSTDAKNGILHRQLLSGSRPLKVLLSKWLAGSLFMLVQFAVLSGAIMLATNSISYYAGSFLSLTVCGVLLCLFASALQLACGLAFKQSEVGSFITLTALAALGGLFIPAVFMPKLLGSISAFTPISAALRLASIGMFSTQSGGIAVSAALLAGYTTVLFAFCMRLMVRRTV